MNKFSPHPPTFTLWSVRNCTVMTLDSDFKMSILWKILFGLQIWPPISLNRVSIGANMCPIRKKGKKSKLSSPHPPAFTLWSVRNCTVMTLDSDFKMGGMDVWFPQYRPISLAVLVLLPLNAATKSYRHLEWSSISKELNLQIEKKNLFVDGLVQFQLLRKLVVTEP